MYSLYFHAHDQDDNFSVHDESLCELIVKFWQTINGRFGPWFDVEPILEMSQTLTGVLESMDILPDRKVWQNQRIGHDVENNYTIQITL